MKSINYRPNLVIDKKYYSDKFYENEDKDIINDIEQPKSEDTKEEIIDRIESIKDAITVLPPELQNGLLPPLIILEDYISKSDDKLFENSDRDNRFDRIDDIYDPDDIFGEPSSSIKVTIDDSIDDPKREFETLIIDISVDYITKIEHILTDFISNISYHTKENNSITSIKSISKINSKDIIDKDLLHLNDNNTKQYHIYDRKIRLYRKIYNLDETVSKIRSCIVSNELRNRLMDTNYKKNDNPDAIESNKLLKRSIKEYKNKFDLSFYNLYKYLNSNATFTKDCLDSLMECICCKSQLINLGGIK